uniref:Uncharacterized protein n=1 Tax=Macaca nemestrina TaxID=9545 RepID=A0A2K6DSI4_MACNE
MPAPSCTCCHPSSGRALCSASFCAAFEAEVLHTVLAGRLLPPAAVVAVGASYGKDSTVVAHVLRAGAAPGHLTAARGLRRGHRRLPGSGAVRSTTNSSRSRSCCTFCGVLQRRALEEGARLPHTLTGHNADDMAETLLMNFLRGDAGRLRDALPRCRPLQFASQKEVVLYAHFRRLDYFSEECVYAPEAFRGHSRDPLKRLEAARRSAVLDLGYSAERLALAPAARTPRPGACSRCGALASRALCQACALPAIGKGRRGLDEEATPGTPGDPARAPTSETVPTF